MDEKVEKFSPIAIPDGIAGLWLAQHIPDSDRQIQLSLGKLIEAMLAEGMRQGTIAAIETLGKSPTIGSAMASLEADMIKINRAYDEARRDS